MALHLTIGCVGKPSAGKSSFLNATTDAVAKVGNYPFTTIDPNQGIAYYQTECPCAQFGLSDKCKPRYGRCEDGTRMVPIKVLDVAGLIPGASEGLGLGNKFLDDLRHADVLLHIVDVSGTTNEKGEETKGYDPINDIKWLNDEVCAWIFNNLWGRWPGVVRKHVGTKSTIAQTLQNQFSGYGTRMPAVVETLRRLGIKEPADIENWDKEYVQDLVAEFVAVRFPTVFVLNKIDMPGADQNIIRICKKYDANRIATTSALAECFLRRLHKQKYIHYRPGEDTFRSSDDPAEDEFDPSTLKPLDEKNAARLEKIRDMVLFRYGSTGVADVVNKAVNLMQPVAAYRVKSLTTFSAGKDEKGVFQDCVLLEPGTTVRQFAAIVHPDIDKYFLYAEGANGQRLGEDEPITAKNNVIKFTTAQAE